VTSRCSCSEQLVGDAVDENAYAQKHAYPVPRTNQLGSPPYTRFVCLTNPHACTQEPPEIICTRCAQLFAMPSQHRVLLNASPPGVFHLTAYCRHRASYNLVYNRDIQVIPLPGFTTFCGTVPVPTQRVNGHHGTSTCLLLLPEQHNHPHTTDVPQAHHLL
jgi:hypothetical protein